MYELCYFAAAILILFANRPLEGDPNLLAMLFGNLVPIPTTIQIFKNWSQSARFT